MGAATLGAVARSVRPVPAGRLGHGEFLELIFQDELNVRHQRMLARRTKAADFRTLKTLEDFDWQFNPSIKRKEIFELAAGSYLRDGKDIHYLEHNVVKVIWPLSKIALIEVLESEEEENLIGFVRE